ncbi:MULTISPECIES: CvpA family protein [unclassified Gilliamella]|uniref:CvpA family protein n=1 Tax=unclassified Gilliamella TaxID=2685620 RepID=UPI000A32ED80|nr:colicin V production protein [Gilliamella sp. N-G2]OTQ79961.1 colicin V production protein [Gilliamella sp. N-W3]
MNWVDYAIIGVIILSALISIVRGFVKEALSLISWVLAFFIASRFYMYITSYLTYFDSDVIRIAVAIAILFISTLIVCAIISYIIGQLVQKTGLSGTDRVLGICFGVLRGILVVALVLFFIDTFTPLSQSQEWKQSQLIPHFHFIIRWFFDFIQQSSSFLVQ